MLQLHKLEIDSFRADRARPARQSLISMECVAADDVKDRLKDVSDEYHNLSTQSTLLGENISDLSSKHQQFNDPAFKLLTWLTEVEGQLASVRLDGGSPEPGKLEAQLQSLKLLSMDALSQRAVLEEMQKRGQDLISSLSTKGIDQQQVDKLQATRNDISGRYTALTKDINAQINGLQAAITQSQDVMQAMDQLLSWMDNAEQAVTSQTPISLQRPILNAQLQGFSALEADITSHISALEAVRASANELVKTCDLDIAKAVEQRLGTLEKKFYTLQSKCKKRDRDLDELDSGLKQFQDKLELSKVWLQSGMSKLDSKDMSKLPSNDMIEQLDKLENEKGNQLKLLTEVKSLAEQLSKDPRTGIVTKIVTFLVSFLFTS